MSHYYKKLNPEEQEALFSQFLISSWSYSKVTSFARNEKAFEMQHIYGLYSKSSASSIAGSAYHAALQHYFQGKKEGHVVDIVSLEQTAFDYISNVPANNWKLSKTMRTVEEYQLKATASATSLIKNFFTEIGVYEDYISEVIDVELYCNEFLTVNGVDIPLPCHAKIDLVAKSKEGKTVIIDHKSKTTFTPDDEMALGIGVQAITYVLCLEAATGTRVDEVWFIENKISKNKDGSPQLNCFKITIDDDTRRLYEALLYEPLRRLIQAVNDPDYVYLINDSDNFVDRAEIYDFWTRTMTTEVDGFNVEESKKELVSKRLKKIRDSSLNVIPPTVLKRFREKATQFIKYDLSSSNMAQEQKIEHALRTFGTIVQVAHKIEGWSSDTYLLEVSAGVKVTSIASHRLDIANALDVSNVRIPQILTVYNGKSYLSIEVTKKRQKDLIFDPAKLTGLRIPLGEDNFGNTVYWDWDNKSTPHALICGATGSGKSVCVKTIIEYAKIANIHDIIIFDPKYEFSDYGFDGSTVVVNEIEQIEFMMAKLVLHMQDMVATRKNKITLVVFDEFADAVANSRKGNQLKDPLTGDKDKSLEENMRILLQKGRSSGFRIAAATQRASVKVITGDAKVNFPVQICFRVPKETDSRVVLDEPGAESLAGLGDGLLKSPEYPDTVRFQAFYKK